MPDFESEPDKDAVDPQRRRAEDAIKAKIKSAPRRNASKSIDDDENGETGSRRILLLLELLSHGSITLEAYSDRYGPDKRTFQRDLAELRRIGDEVGFEISRIRSVKHEKVVTFRLEDGSLIGKDDEGRSTAAMMETVAAALGAPASLELGPRGTGLGEQSFLRFQLAKSIENSSILNIYEQLKDAWSSIPRQTVTFDFDDGSGQSTPRRVEPHRVIMRSGNAYLIGYDLARSSWTSFGLHRMTTLPVRDQGVNKVRDMPTDLDLHGFAGSGGLSALRYVGIIAVNPPIPLSLLTWIDRPGHKVEYKTDGSAHISIPTSDLNEIVRLSIQFGDGAKVIGPPEAVELAKTRLEKMAASYRADSRAK